MKKHGMKLAAAYCRMSTDRQDKSIPGQRAEIERYAKSHGYTIVAWYEDHGISGDATNKRREFQRLIVDAESGTFLFILVWDQDRFGRFDSIEAGYWIHPLREAGVQLVTVNDGPIDWNDFSGRLLYSLKQEGKNQFLVDLSRNVTRGLLNSAKDGRWATGRPPYGYALDADRRLELGDPRHVETVAWLFDNYAERDTSLAALAEELNRRSVAGPTGGIWRIQTIQTILRNPNYCGDLVWNRRHHGKYHGIVDGEIAKHADVEKTKREDEERQWRHLNRDADHVLLKENHPSIVSRETFEVVQAKLKARRLRTTPHRGGGSFILSDLLRCGHCGAKMYGADRKSKQNGREYVYRRYVCASYVQSGRSKCNHHAMIEDPVREYLASVIQERVLNPESLDRLRAEVAKLAKQRRRPTRCASLSQLRKKLADIDAQLDRAVDRLLKVPESVMVAVVAKMESLRDQRAEILAAIDAVENVVATPVDAIVAKATDKAARLRECLQSGEPAAVREALRQTIDRVECWFEKQQRGTRTYYPFSRGIVYLRQDLDLSQLVQPATARRCAKG